MSEPSLRKIAAIAPKLSTEHLSEILPEVEALMIVLASERMTRLVKEHRGHDCSLEDPVKLVDKWLTSLKKDVLYVLKMQCDVEGIPFCTNPNADLVKELLNESDT